MLAEELRLLKELKVSCGQGRKERKKKKKRTGWDLSLLERILERKSFT